MDALNDENEDLLDVIKNNLKGKIDEVKISNKLNIE